MRGVTDQEINNYRKHGVVFLEGLLDPEWLDLLAQAYDHEMSAETESLVRLDVGETASVLSDLGVELLAGSSAAPTGRFEVRTFNWRQFPSIAQLGCRPPMPQLVAQLMGSSRINFFGEQAFYKEAGSLHRTAFHQDLPYFHLEGGQCCTIWMPLDVVDAENGMMGYVRGSHRWETYAANVFASQAPIPGSTLTHLPDIEGREDEFDLVYYPARPGDAIVHHVRTVHGSTGNTSTRDRRALALRYTGDDVRYRVREGAPPDSQQSPALQDGDVLDSDEFPLIWTAEQGYLAEI